MTRRKAIWVAGTIGKNFNSVQGIVNEAKRQARRVMGCKNVKVVDFEPSSKLEGYYFLVERNGGSNASGGSRQEKGNEE